MEGTNNLTFDITLFDSNEEEAGFKFHNATPDEVNRLYLTGYGRKDTTVVRGRLVHMVHGFHDLSFPDHLQLDPEEQYYNPQLGTAESDQTPCTLMVFEWNMIPGSLEPRYRFRTVHITLVFSASHPRVGVPPNGDISLWDPVPKRIVPSEQNPMLSHFTPVNEVSSSGFTLGPTVGYDGIISFNTEFSKSKQVGVQFTSAAAITGQIDHEERTFGEPNAVLFTFFENPKAKTGVPPVVRTAVLLRRQKRDLRGKFTMTIKVSSDVNWWQDSREKARRAIGGRLRDDPVNFDPGDSDVVQDGEKVKRRDCKIRGVDWRKLGNLDLNQFLVNYAGSSSTLKEKESPALDTASLKIDDESVSGTAPASKDDANTVSAATRVNSDD